MKGSIPALLLDKKLAEAKKALMSVPASNGQKMVYSALVGAEERIRHLEHRLGETETMRDRIAMQLLPSALACHTEQGDRSDSGSIRRAYELADEVLAVRVQGSAGAPGETTSPENSIPVYRVGDKLRLRGQTATVTDATAGHDGVWCYDLGFDDGGSEGSYTAADIAELRDRA